MSEQDSDREKDDEILREWCNKLMAALEVRGLEVDIKSVLGLAGRAAHSVLRPAAPSPHSWPAMRPGLLRGPGRRPRMRR